MHLRSKNSYLKFPPKIFGVHPVFPKLSVADSVPNNCTLYWHLNIWWDFPNFQPFFPCWNISVSSRCAAVGRYLTLLSQTFSVIISSEPVVDGTSAELFTPNNIWFIKLWRDTQLIFFFSREITKIEKNLNTSRNLYYLQEQKCKSCF